MHILIALLPSLLWGAMALLNAAFPAEPRRQNTFVIAGGGAASLLTSPLTGATWSLHSLAWGMLSGLLWSIGIIFLLKGFQTWGTSRTMPLTAALQLTLNGLIGVVLAMLLTDSAVGFVAYLGILALFGMIIRNSVILIDQIKKHEDAGEQPMDAIIDSAVLRFRPIMLTAAAAILGMLPLMRSICWGPMAVAIAGGLIVATVLTLLVLPVMYAVAYRVKE